MSALLKMKTFLLFLLVQLIYSTEDETCETLPSGDVSCKPSTSSSPLCTIPRISSAKITSSIFLEKYYLKQPVIITNVITSPKNKPWTSEILLNKYGDIQVGVGSSRTIVKMGGTGRATAKLGDVIKAARTSSIHQGDVDVFAFDRDSALFEQAPELIDSLRDTASAALGDMFKSVKIPKRKWNATTKPIYEKYRYFLSLGGKGSGVHLHHHSDGWNLLFEGRKRWFLRPPYTLPSITHMGFMRMRYWLNEGVYPKLKKSEKPLECIQQPGELIYIPESWWHGTINEGETTTLSVAAQLRVAATTEEKYLLKASEYKNSGKNKKAYTKLKKLIAKQPNHSEAWYLLGIIYGRVRKLHLADELEAKERANELTHSRSCDVKNNLGTGYVHNKNYKKAEQVLKEVIELCPWDDFAWSNLAAALHHQGKDEEAEQAFEKGKKVRDQWGQPDRVSVGEEELML